MSTSEQETVGLLTIAEVAQRKGVRVSTIYEAVKAGRLPSRQVLGKTVITEADCDAWQKQDRGGNRGGGRPKKSSA